MKSWRVCLLSLALMQGLCAQSVDELLQNEKFDDATELLTKELAAEDSEEKRILLGRIYAHLGKTEEAIKVWEAGLKGKKEDANLLGHLAQIYEQLAEDGPSVERAGGQVTYHPSKMTDEAEAAWSKERWGKAAGYYQKVVDYGFDEALALLALCKQKSGDSTCVGDWMTYLKKHPEDMESQVHFIQAMKVHEGSDWALKELNELMEKYPKSAELLALQVEFAELNKAKPEEIEALKKKAQFYAWVPSFCKLMDYEGKALEWYSKLQDREKLDITAEQLVKDGSELSSEMLAAVCYHHLSHGAIEQKCFGELKKRGKGDLLMALIKDPQSLCTIREGGMMVAELKHPEAFDVLMYYLPHDTRPVHTTNAAAALAVLGDPRAVEGLIAVLAVDQRDADRQNPDRDFMGDGSRMNRVRCALALGHFDAPEVREVLGKGLNNPDVALSCHASLYRLGKDKKHLEALQKAIESDDRDLYWVLTGLQDLKDESLQKVMDAWKTKREAEEAKEKE